MNVARINGVSIAYRDRGSGTPILFIHGHPFNQSMWDRQVGEKVSLKVVRQGKELNVTLVLGPDGSKPHVVVTRAPQVAFQANR